MDKNDDIQIIKAMYKGEYNRDATSKIRGYMFQDLIAIDKLLDKETICVLCEYIEDILVITQDNVQIIQAKYYSKSDIKKNEVIRELYYQFLRLKLKKYTKKIIPTLAMHTEKKLIECKVSDMKKKEYIGVDKNETPLPEKDIDIWLSDNVYKKKKNEAQNNLFKRFAWNQSMQEFLDNYKEDNYKKIGTYRRKIEEKLQDLVSGENTEEILDDKSRGPVLLGLAVQYIHRKYDSEIVKENEDETFQVRMCQREKFVDYLIKGIAIDNDETISAYMQAVVLEHCASIIENNKDMTKEQQDMLGYIAKKTAEWFAELGKNVSGQYCLVNTLSFNFKISDDEFAKKGVSERRTIIVQLYNNIEVFLRYLWRILMSLNNVLLGKELSEDEKRKLDPKSYIDTTKKKCLCFKLQKEMAKSIVILPELPNSSAGEKLANIFERMCQIEPEKWYMSSKYRGRYRYDLQVSEIKKGNSVTSMGEKHFRIECMECVNTDECWHEIEEYDTTLYMDKCKKEI